MKKYFHITELLSRITRFVEINLSTTTNLKPAHKVEPFLKQIIPETMATQNDQPAMEEMNFRTSHANLFSVTTFGGPGSKYRTINEDSLFSGVNVKGELFVGVIDGSGGSKFGYLGGKLANETLAQELINGQDLSQSFVAADKNVMKHGRGGYATGAALTIDPSQIVHIASKGDTKVMTIRNGQKLEEGTSLIQSKVAELIESEILPPHSIHTARNKNIVCSIIGNTKRPLYQTSFQGQAGDVIVMGTDGLWDVVSDYEIVLLSKEYRGYQLQLKLFDLAYKRNNSKTEFEIQFNENECLVIKGLHADGKLTCGDNITVVVLELQPPQDLSFELESLGG